MFEWMFFVLSCLIIVFTVPFTQATLTEINPSNFRRVKLRKFKWLFRTIGSKDSIYSNIENFGIPIPIFILHIMGYILAFINIVLTIYVLIINNESTQFVLVSVYIWSGYTIIVITLYSVLIFVSKYRDKNNK